MNDQIQRQFAEACETSTPYPPSEVIGILSDVPNAEYHRREERTVSNSALTQMARSPAHYQAWLHGIEEAPTAAMQFGTAFHCALLEPERFARTFVVPPSFGDQRSKENRLAKAAWIENHPGVVTLDAEDESAIFRMIAAVMAHPAASRLVLEGQAEVTLRWRDPITGLASKARADYWVKKKGFAVDVKTTEDASPEAFARSCVRFRYHVQDALYRQGFAELGSPIEHFAILAVEKQRPHAVAVYTLDEDAITKGYNAARGCITRLAECIERNDWPSYSPGVEALSLPPWAA